MGEAQRHLSVVGPAPVPVARVAPLVGAADLRRLRRAYSDSLPCSASTEESLRSTLEAVLSVPGSMVRAQLSWLVAKGYGLAHETALKLAIGVEYFHSASLLFDDLPAMDDAIERRGVPCPHRLWGEGAAILAALALINRAYALIWSALATAHGEAGGQAAALVESCLGLDGVVNGQALDLAYAGSPRRGEAVEEIAVGKTVTLIRLCLLLPAILGGASEDELERFEALASGWGLAYQALDDLKDVLLETFESGKTADRDRTLGRPNLALAEGPESVLDRVEELLEATAVALSWLEARRGVRLEGLQALLESELDGLRGRGLAAAVSA